MGKLHVNGIVCLDSSSLPACGLNCFLLLCEVFHCFGFASHYSLFHWWAYDCFQVRTVMDNTCEEHPPPGLLKTVSHLLPWVCFSGVGWHSRDALMFPLVGFTTFLQSNHARFHVPQTMNESSSCSGSSSGLELVQLFNCNHSVLHIVLSPWCVLVFP